MGGSSGITGLLELSVFVSFHFRLEFVGDLVCRYGQQVFLLSGEAIVVLIEVKYKRGKGMTAL